METPIDTTRLVLRPMDDRDADAVIAVLTDSKVTVTYMVPDLTAEQAHRLFLRLRDLSHDSAHFVRGIYLKDRLIGFLNDTEIEDGAIELGWALHPQYHNCGYATEAVGAAISHLLANGFNRVIAAAFSQNLPSLRVMQKCGMQKMEKTELIDYRGQTHLCIYYCTTAEI